MHDGRTRKVQSIGPVKAHAFLVNHRVCLTLTTGPNAGTEFALEGARSIAGRSTKAEIIIEDPSISSEHAAFELGSDGFGVRDLASTNGVQVNGSLVSSAALIHGDRIRLGDCELQYVVENRSRPPKAWSMKENP